jgi:hypothetical protein
MTRPPYPGGYSRRNARTSARKIRLREKQAEALEMRKAGLDFKNIARAMKTSMTTVFRWVTEEMDRVAREPAKMLLQMELERLDRLQAGIYARAARGDLAAIVAVLRIMDQRAKLLGWYPERPDFNLSLAAEANGYGVKPSRRKTHPRASLRHWEAFRQQPYRPRR